MPTFMRWWTLVVMGLIVSGIWFGATASLPRIARTTGYVMHSAGVAKVHVPNPGLLTQLRVVEGQLVQQGEVLGYVTTERLLSGGSVEMQQAQQSKLKQNFLDGDIKLASQIETAAMHGMVSRQEKLTNELHSLEKEIKLAQQRVADIEVQVERFEMLGKSGFISKDAMENKRGELIEQTLRLNALVRNRDGQKKELDILHAEMTQTRLRSLSQQTQLKRERANAEQELTEHRAKTLPLLAPVSGVVTQLVASLGQAVRSDIPVLILVPNTGSYEVQLLIPSRSVGFVRPRQAVSVRYQAYPHEHYGRHKGYVKSVSYAALPPQEVIQHIRTDEPVYSVRVTLPDNSLKFEGNSLPLSAGMVVDADVELDRLKIYQWLLEPLYRLGGRL